MILPRFATKSLKNVLENYLPPKIRDSDLISKYLLRMTYGAGAEAVYHFHTNKHEYSIAQIKKLYSKVRSLSNTQASSDITNNQSKHISKNVLGDSVLDVGYGRGELLLHLRDTQSLIKLAGCDLITSTSLPSNIKIKQGALEKLPYPKNSFDTVVSTHTLEHVLDIHIALAEIRRVATRRVIIIVPIERPYRITPNLHTYYFPNKSVFLQTVRPQKKYSCSVIDQDLYYQEDV